jgi:predicted nucleic acid-binding protein
VILADTGAMLALLDADDRHHKVVRRLYEQDPGSWIVPWAVLPELDYLVGKELGAKVELAWLADLAAGVFVVEWGKDDDLIRAEELARRYKALELGLVDATVIAVAERLGAKDIATLDVRDFGAVSIRGAPRLLPRDL